MVNRLHEFPLTDRQWNHNATKKNQFFNCKAIGIYLFYIYLHNDI